MTAYSNKTNSTQFIEFAGLADEATRAEIAHYLTDKLRNKNPISPKPAGKDATQYVNAIDEITNHRDLLEISRLNPGVAEQVSNTLLEWIGEIHKKMLRVNPFEEEESWLAAVINKKPWEFAKQFGETRKYVESIYKPSEFDISFYENKLKEKKAKIRAIKNHFQETWTAKLLARKLKHEIREIDEARKKFCEELYRRIEEFKKLKQVMEPFTNDLGRLWDMSGGIWKRTDFNILQHYAELMKKEPTLMKLAEMLGRFRQSEKEYEEELYRKTVIKTEWKTEYAAKSELVGIHESGDLSNIIPTEAVLLADEETEGLFFKKFAEKKLLTFEYHSRFLDSREEQITDKRLKAKEKDKGPIIICVDTSGSMHGVPEQVAKVMCFAILKIALQDNRKVYLISFSTAIQTLELTDLRNSLDAVINFLLMSFNGGTDAEPALQEALKMLNNKDFKDADVLMISDFIMPNLGDTIQKEIQKAKSNKTRFHSLAICDSGNPSTINQFDHNWVYNPNNGQGLINLVKNARSIMNKT